MDKVSFTQMREHQKLLIGKGIRYPNLLNDRVGDLAVSDDLDEINQSIYAILSTRKGERFMMPEFGSDIYKYVFEPNRFILQDLVTTEITDSLRQWEQRVHVRGITYEQYENTLEATITYNVLNSNQTGSYVYPINLSTYDMNSGTKEIFEQY